MHNADKTVRLMLDAWAAQDDVAIAYIAGVARGINWLNEAMYWRHSNALFFAPEVEVGPEHLVELIQAYVETAREKEACEAEVLVDQLFPIVAVLALEDAYPADTKSIH